MILADSFISGISSTTLQWWIHVFFELMISVLAVFLILLVLVQRGRGGGLAGALGGMGGQSAFGTRAGDTFTWITYTTAAIWILLAALTIKTFTDPHADKQAMRALKERREQGETEIAPRGNLSTPANEEESGDMVPGTTTTQEEGGDKAAKPNDDAPPNEKAPAADSSPADPPVGRATEDTGAATPAAEGEGNDSSPEKDEQ